MRYFIALLLATIVLSLDASSLKFVKVEKSHLPGEEIHSTVNVPVASPVKVPLSPIIHQKDPAMPSVKAVLAGAADLAPAVAPFIASPAFAPVIASFGPAVVPTVLSPAVAPIIANPAFAPAMIPAIAPFVQSPAFAPAIAPTLASFGPAVAPAIAPTLASFGPAVAPAIAPTLARFGPAVAPAVAPFVRSPAAAPFMNNPIISRGLSRPTIAPTTQSENHGTANADKTSGGAAFGGIVGGVVGSAAVIGVLALLYFRNRRREYAGVDSATGTATGTGAVAASTDHVEMVFETIPEATATLTVAPAEVVVKEEAVVVTAHLPVGDSQL